MENSAKPSIYNSFGYKKLRDPLIKFYRGKCKGLIYVEMNLLML